MIFSNAVGGDDLSAYSNYVQTNNTTIKRCTAKDAYSDSRRDGSVLYTSAFIIINKFCLQRSTETPAGCNVQSSWAKVHRVNMSCYGRTFGHHFSCSLLNWCITVRCQIDESLWSQNHRRMSRGWGVELQPSLPRVVQSHHFWDKRYFFG